MSLVDYSLAGFTAIPALLLLFVHNRKKISAAAILWSLLAGVVISFAGNAIKLMGIKIGAINSDPLFNFIYALFAIGSSMQLLQFLFCRLVIYPDKEFKTVDYGLVYCIWISIGITISRFMMLDFYIHPLVTVLNVLGQLFIAMIFGYFLTMAKFTTDASLHFRNLNTGLASAIIIQGLHEFFLIEGQIPNLIVLVLGSGFLCLLLMADLFRQFNRKNNTLKKAQTGDKD